MNMNEYQIETTGNSRRNVIYSQNQSIKNQMEATYFQPQIVRNKPYLVDNQPLHSIQSLTLQSNQPQSITQSNQPPSIIQSNQPTSILQSNMQYTSIQNIHQTNINVPVNSSYRNVNIVKKQPRLVSNYSQLDATLHSPNNSYSDFKYKDQKKVQIKQNMPETDKFMFDKIDNSLKQINFKKKMLNASIDNQLSLYRSKNNNNNNNPYYQQNKLYGSYQRVQEQMGGKCESKYESRDQSSHGNRSNQNNQYSNQNDGQSIQKNSQIYSQNDIKTNSQGGQIQHWSNQLKQQNNYQNSGSNLNSSQQNSNNNQQPTFKQLYHLKKAKATKPSSRHIKNSSYDFTNKTQQLAGVHLKQETPKFSGDKQAQIVFGSDSKKSINTKRSGSIEKKFRSSNIFQQIKIEKSQNSQNSPYKSDSKRQYSSTKDLGKNKIQNINLITFNETSPIDSSLNQQRQSKQAPLCQQKIHINSNDDKLKYKVNKQDIDLKYQLNKIKYNDIQERYVRQESLKKKQQTQDMIDSTKQKLMLLKNECQMNIQKIKQVKEKMNNSKEMQKQDYQEDIQEDKDLNGIHS